MAAPLDQANGTQCGVQRVAPIVANARKPPSCRFFSAKGSFFPRRDSARAMITPEAHDEAHINYKGYAVTIFLEPV
jgi:hypothetical protein